MPNDMEHERMRWRTMNVRQLETRLGKITDRQKLENFRMLADEYAATDYRYRRLLEMVNARLNRSTSRPPIRPEQLSDGTPIRRVVARSEPHVIRVQEDGSEEVMFEGSNALEQYRRAQMRAASQQMLEDVERLDRLAPLPPITLQPPLSPTGRFSTPEPNMQQLKPPKKKEEPTIRKLIFDEKKEKRKLIFDKEE